MFRTILLSAACLFTMTSLVSAMDMKVGDLSISNPTIRATAPGAKVAAGYVMITNTGDAADRIIGGSAEFAGKLELHEMKMVDQVMKMSQLPNGLELKPGESVMLKPGGNHLMFMKLDGALKEGEMRPVMLEFEKAGQVTLNFHVKSIADTMKMKHSH
ncbi:MAG: copper chaperone PCu(A)C [Rhizobiaceae bacterium]